MISKPIQSLLKFAQETIQKDRKLKNVYYDEIVKPTVIAVEGLKEYLSRIEMNIDLFNDKDDLADFTYPLESMLEHFNDMEKYIVEIIKPKIIKSIRDAKIAENRKYRM